MYATIRDKRNLYFRAMLVSSWGLSLRAQAYLMQYFNHDIPWWIAGTLSQIGWICMVSGFALVLWSRLGFILGSERVKKALLGMIIFNGCVFHTTMTVLAMIIWAMNSGFEIRQKEIAAHAGAIQRVFECVQIVFFNGQEMIISSLYIRAAYVYLRDWSRLGAAGSRRRVRRAMILLLIIQAIVVFIDAALITIDLLGLLQLKGMIHSFIYCVKLELEFLVLNQLVEISKLGVPGLPSSSRDSGQIDEATARAAASTVLMETAIRLEEESPVETKSFAWDGRMQLKEELKNPCVTCVSCQARMTPLPSPRVIDDIDAIERAMSP